MSQTVMDMAVARERYRALPFPEDVEIDGAASDLQQMAKVDGLVGGIATFRRVGLDSTGWWRPDDDYPSLDGIDLPVPSLYVDSVDPDDCHRRNFEQCRLAIRHAIERYDLGRAQTRRWYEEAEALGEEAE